MSDETQDVQQDVLLIPAKVGEVVADVGVNGYVREEIVTDVNMNEVKDNGDESS